MKRFKIIALTHRNATLDEVGRLHIPDDEWGVHLSRLPSHLGLHELMYLTTCNRVEFLFTNETAVQTDFISRLFSALQPRLSAEEAAHLASRAIVYEGAEALEHIFKVTASLDSMVVGEREIITQVRNAFEKCHKLGLTGDTLRLVVQCAIQTAKRVYTETQISERPVSVVSLAYRRLKELQPDPAARFLIIGAGQTIVTMAKYLNKHGFRNFTVFNRTPSRAKNLAQSLNAEAYDLEALKTYGKGFDVMITCTGASDPIVDEPLYRRLLQGEEDRKVIVDLAIPHDVDPVINTRFNTTFVQVNHLKAIAAENMAERTKELKNCGRIIGEEATAFSRLLRTRKVEVAMRQVPSKVKEIRENALTKVFARDLEALDEQSREVMDRVLAYMEKKYISVPMKMAREIILGNDE